jgi:peptidoglycan/LPS O-acetylase OafA/YrhL
MNGPFNISTSFSVVLNIVRFLCSQGVVLGHLFIFFGIKNRFFEALPSFCVLMFFILSGFLISHSLMQHAARNENYSFGSYVRDRFFRIYPPFLAALVLVFIVDLVGFHFTSQYYSMKIYIGNFFINAAQLQEYPLATYINEHYMIEFFRFHYFGTNLPLWTISIEWWLYIFFGFLFFLILKKKPITLWNGLILLLLSITPVYYLFVGARMERGLTLYWFLGMVISLQSAKQFQTKDWVFYANCLLLLISMSGFLHFGYTGSALLFFLSLFLLARTTSSTVHVADFVRKLADKLAGYSYSLYLVHYSIIYFIITVFKFEKGMVNFIVVFLIVNVIAFMFAEIFEKNSKKLKLIYENNRSGNH